MERYSEAMNTAQTYSERVASEVRAQLARAGKDGGDLAAILGVSRPTALGRWRGATTYTLDELDAIASALNVPVAAIVLPGIEQAAAA